MPGIFINYRRDDAPGVAGRLYDYLARSFSHHDLFIDVDYIKPGLDFVKQLDAQVSQCDVMLALMGPHWLSSADEQGRRKLHSEKDYVRIELASALKRDIPVIPVLVHGATMPSEDELPEDLKSLTRRQALELRHTRFASDADAIASALKSSLPKRGKRWLWPTAAAACLVGGFGVWFFYIWPGPAPPEPIPTTAPQLSADVPRFSEQAQGQATPSQECPASPPGPGYLDSGFKYVLTEKIYAPDVDLDAAAKAEYGPEAAVADWSELRRSLTTDHQVINFIRSVGLEHQKGDDRCRNYFVKNEGKSFFSANYRYLIARHDGVQPGDWLILDHLGTGYLDLGRWTHPSQIIVRVPE